MWQFYSTPQQIVDLIQKLVNDGVPYPIELGGFGLYYYPGSTAFYVICGIKASKNGNSYLITFSRCANINATIIDATSISATPTDFARGLGIFFIEYN